MQLWVTPKTEKTLSLWQRIRSKFVKLDWNTMIVERNNSWENIVTLTENTKKVRQAWNTMIVERNNSCHQHHCRCAPTIRRHSLVSPPPAGRNNSLLSSPPAHPGYSKCRSVPPSRMGVHCDNLTPKTTSPSVGAFCDSSANNSSAKMAPLCDTSATSGRTGQVKFDHTTEAYHLSRMLVHKQFLREIKERIKVLKLVVSRCVFGSTFCLFIYLCLFFYSFVFLLFFFFAWTPFDAWFDLFTHLPTNITREICFLTTIELCVLFLM
jgi:hypothetical protein